MSLGSHLSTVTGNSLIKSMFIMLSLIESAIASKTSMSRACAIFLMHPNLPAAALPFVIFIAE